MRNELLVYACHLKKLYAQVFQLPAKEFGLTQVEIDVLLFLYNNPEYNTARDICMMRGIAKSNVSTAVEALKKRGFLSSHMDRENRKLHRLFLSSAAMDVGKVLAVCQERCISEAMKGFSPEELTLMRQFQKRMDDNITSALHRLENTEQ